MPIVAPGQTPMAMSPTLYGSQGGGEQQQDDEKEMLYGLLRKFGIIGGAPQTPQTPGAAYTMAPGGGAPAPPRLYGTSDMDFIDPGF